MKVCEVTPGLIPIPLEGAGAVENIILALSLELGRRGHAVHVIDVATPTPFEPPPNVSFVRVPNLPIPNRGIAHLIRGVYFMFAASLAVARLIRKGDVDVIHIHNQFSGFLILILNNLLWRKPLVFTTHNQEIFASGAGRRASCWPERYILSKAETVVCVSPTVKNLLISQLGLDPGKLVQIYSGVELPTGLDAGPAPRRDHTFKIITVARIVPRKNQLLVIEAARKVCERVPQAQFDFIGPVDDTAYLERLQQATRDFGLARHVTLRGEVDRSELERAYAEADLFVLTSTNENQGLVILEAMAHSVPVVCSNIGPFVDMLAGEEDAATVVRDENELATAIIDFYLQPDRRERQIAAAKRLVARFAWPNIAAEYEELFGRVQRTPPGPAKLVAFRSDAE